MTDMGLSPGGGGPRSAWAGQLLLTRTEPLRPHAAPGQARPALLGPVHPPVPCLDAGPSLGSPSIFLLPSGLCSRVSVTPALTTSAMLPLTSWLYEFAPQDGARGPAGAQQIPSGGKFVLSPAGRGTGPNSCDSDGPAENSRLLVYVACVARQPRSPLLGFAGPRGLREHAAGSRDLGSIRGAGGWLGKRPDLTAGFWNPGSGAPACRKAPAGPTPACR